MSSWLRNLRYVFRSLVREPAFAAAVLVTLILGTGATSAVLSVVYGLLLTPLPYADPAALMAVTGSLRRGAAVEPAPMSYLDLEDLRQTGGAFQDLVARSGARSFNLLADGEPEHVEGEYVDDGYFRLLGVAPSPGRGFRREESRSGAGRRVAVVGHALWQRRFAGSTDLRDRTLWLDGEPFQIVGVAPPGFRGLSDVAEVWLPLGLAGQLLAPPYVESRSFRWLSAVGRLAQGASVAQAQQELDARTAALAQRFPDTNAAFGARVKPLVEAWFGDLRRPLAVLLAAAALVLLVACINVANLFLVRAATREQELALRAALGAGRRHVLGRQLTESVALAVLAALAALPLALLVTRGLLAASALDLRSFVHVGLDPSWVAGSVLIAALCGIAFGLPPARAALSVPPRQVLNQGQRGAVGGAGTRLRSTLLVVQVTLTVLLLVGSGLLVSAFGRLRGSELGFEPAGLLTFRVDLKGPRYASDEAVWSLADEARERIAALPGVSSVALAGPSIPTDGWNGTYADLEGEPAPPPGEERILITHYVTPGYFSTLGIDLVAGRAFGSEDRGHDGWTLVLSESAARSFWPGDDPLGKRLRLGPLSFDPPWRRVVGVVADVRHRGLTGDERPGPDGYIPLLQEPPRRPPVLNFLVRSDGKTAEALAPSLRQVVHDLAPDLPLYDVASMEERLRRQAAQGRFVVLLVSSFTALALILAAVGVYGLVSHEVARRRREIGIRRALGAPATHLLRVVAGRAALHTAMGLALGLAVGWLWLPRLLHGLLSTDGAAPAVDGRQPLLAAAVLLLTALLASLLPLRRALRLHVADVLRRP